MEKTQKIMNSKSEILQIRGDQPLQSQETEVNKKSKRTIIKEQILPFRLLPDVSSVKIVTSEEDPLFATFGIAKSLKKAELIIVPAQNAGYNRYIVYKLKYMKKLNDQQYGNQVNQILRNSNVFYMTAVNHVMKKWSRTEPVGKIRKEIRRAKALASMEQIVTSKRFYVQKSNGKTRPIAAPSNSGKIYLHLLNNFLAFRLQEKVNINQHGFVAGRGTLTAGREILKNVVNSPDIYEIDLKGAFDSITNKHIAKTLDDHGVPKAIVSKLILASISPLKFEESKNVIALNNPVGVHEQPNTLIKDFDEDHYRGMLFGNSIIRITKDYGVKDKELHRLLIKATANFGKGNKKYFKADEIDRLNKIEVSDIPKKLNDIGANILGDRGPLVWSILDKLENNKSEKISDIDGTEVPKNVYENVNTEDSVTYKDPDGNFNTFKGTRKQIRDHLKKVILKGIKKYKRSRTGVAQGCPTSPFIFALCVNKMFFEKNKENCHCVAYADDAIFHGVIKHEKEILNRASIHTGLEFNLEKSGGVKRNGEGLKPLKFLGMVLDFNMDKITGKSQTRSERTLTFDKDLLLYLYEQRKTEFDVLTESEIRAFNVTSDGEIGKLYGELYSSKDKQYHKLGEKVTKKTYSKTEIDTLINDKHILKMLSDSELLGFIQSRMYIGSGDYDIDQDFKLSHTKDSWIAQQKKKNYFFNIFNCSSYAVEELLKNPNGKESYKFKLVPRRYKDLFNPSSKKLNRYPSGWPYRNVYLDEQNKIREPFFPLPLIRRRSTRS